MFHVILYQPEIPPNTGNAIRLCANSGCTLHLVEPLGFELDEPRLKRAGLDYHELAVVRRHASLAECLGSLDTDRVFAVETGIGRPYTEVAFQPGDALLFGRETGGLPRAVLAALPPAQCVSIPMLAGNRSLNLSNAVAVVVYEAWRQQGFAGAGAALAGVPPAGS